MSWITRWKRSPPPPVPQCAAPREPLPVGTPGRGASLHEGGAGLVLMGAVAVARDELGVVGRAGVLLAVHLPGRNIAEVPRLDEVPGGVLGVAAVDVDGTLRHVEGGVAGVVVEPVLPAGGDDGAGHGHHLGPGR